MKKSGFVLGLLLLFSVCVFAQNIKEVDGIYLSPDSKPYSGKYSSQFGNGNIKMEMYLKKGLKDGQVRIYFPDGQLNEIRAYRKNLMHGTWIVFNEKG
ncbi:MAG: hypothetical protein JNL03_08755, partial [Prolixibacteraceae bacterium]|nr:hypothetical protein [Prolixibacteraceae bacterium]